MKKLFWLMLIGCFVFYGCENKEQTAELEKQRNIAEQQKQLVAELQNTINEQLRFMQQQQTYNQNLEKEQQQLKQQIVELNKIVEQYNLEQQKTEQQEVEKQKEDEYIQELYLSEYQKQGRIPIIGNVSIAVGEIGQFADWREFQAAESGNYKGYKCKVIQVIDSTNMLVEVYYSGIGISPRAKSIWIEGMATNGIVDDQNLILTQVFYIKGTKTYSTQFGSTSTVFHAQVVNIK